MTVRIVTTMDGEELDSREVSGYRGAGWWIKQQEYELGLTYTGEARKYETADGTIVEFAITTTQGGAR